MMVNEQGVVQEQQYLVKNLYLALSLFSLYFPSHQSLLLTPSMFWEIKDRICVHTGTNQYTESSSYPETLVARQQEVVKEQRSSLEQNDTLKAKATRTDLWGIQVLFEDFREYVGRSDDKILHFLCLWKGSLHQKSLIFQSKRLLKAGELEDLKFTIKSKKNIIKHTS